MIKTALFSQAAKESDTSAFLSLSPTHALWMGKKMLSFASHDYLGISQHAELKKSAVRALLQYGSGNCFSDVDAGFSEFQQNIEERCSLMLGMQECSFFSSRLSALSFLLLALNADDSLLLVDEECDPVLQVAAGLWTGKTVRFSSQNMKTLTQALEKKGSCLGPKLILSDSISSFSGKLTDLNALYSAAKKHEALVLIDDTNALGAHGINGLGLASPSSSVDFLLFAMDRGAGCSGALLASNFKMKRLLNLPSFPFRDCALSYSALGAIDSAIELIPQLEGERNQLQQRCHFLKDRLEMLGAQVDSMSHLFCFPFKQKEQAQVFCRSLAENDILGEVIEYGERCYVRLIVNAAHTPEDLNHLVAVLTLQR